MKSENTSSFRYRCFWVLGNLVSFILYFSGIWILHRTVRKKISQKFNMLVLTYHRISDQTEDRDIRVRVKSFEEQMKYLKQNFRVVSLSEIVDCIRNNEDLSSDTIAVTFDDGYEDNYLNAYPILEKQGIPATIFLATGRIGKKNGYLNENEIRLMTRLGIGFASHTVTHPILSCLSDDKTREELSISMEFIETIVGKKVQYLAYPKGKSHHFTERTKKIAREIGYEAAFSTENGLLGPDSDLFALNRIGIRECPLFTFKLRLSGLYEIKLFYNIRKKLNLT